MGGCVDIRVYLDSGDGNMDLTAMLRDAGIAYKYGDKPDPRAMGPDPVVIITLVLTAVNTVCAVLSTVKAMRPDGKARVESDKGSAEITTDKAELGRTLQSWFFPEQDGRDTPEDH